ncbi:MAG TPA: hypothetical protein VF733_04755 [Candidatus Saccharimonadales bacterium]
MSSEIMYDPSPMLNVKDAFYMGQLHELGLAAPDDRVLRKRAETVTPERMVDAAVQHEIGRMIKVAQLIEVLDIGKFGGLAHNQLRPTTPDAMPLRLVLVPTEMPDTPFAYEGSWAKFQLLGNVSFLTPSEKPEPAEDDDTSFEKVKDGCFSSATVSVPKNIWTTIYDVQGLNVEGRLVHLPHASGKASRSLQHEILHTHGLRSGDRRGAVRNIVHRDQVWGVYEEFRDDRAYEWSPRLSDVGWHNMTYKDPNYLYPNDELREAFEAGAADVRNRAA